MLHVVFTPSYIAKGESTGFVIGTEKQGIVHITVGKDGKSVDKHEQIFLPAWLPNHRFNDGKVDPVGRFVVGTMGAAYPCRLQTSSSYSSDMEEKGATGSLYVLSFDGSAKEIDTKVTVRASAQEEAVTHLDLAGFERSRVVSRRPHVLLH